MSNKYVLGLSCLYHDSSAVLLKGGEIIAASQEERFTRKKFDSSVPVNAVKSCLEIAGLQSISEVDSIAIYDEPILKLDRIVSSHTFYSPLNFVKNTNKVYKWMQNKLFVERHLKANYPEFKGNIYFFPHHLSHAASAFFPSPFEESTILTIDGVGEWSCASISHGKGNNIEVLKEQNFPHSLGFLYSAFTQYIGFRVDSGEYKLMGLAPYGTPKFVETIYKHLISVGDDGSLELNTKYFDFMSGSRMVNSKFCELFGGAERESEGDITQKEMDIAASIQVVTEEIVLKMVKYAIELTGVRNLCMAGGVALNCVSNGKIVRSGLVDKIWIQPASGDSGGGLGAAYLTTYKSGNILRKIYSESDSQKNSLLGPSYTDDEICKVLDAYGFKYTKMRDNERASKIASVIEQGDIVGLFQGRMEFGPRALGNRSILGDPRDKEMQKKMNLKIKFRESFRPFAPIVKEDKVKFWFDIDTTSPYMMIVADIIKEKRKKISNNEGDLFGIEKLKVPHSIVPAVTHVDFSARLQTVSENSNKDLYDILDEFDKLTGCPILINTSFNIRGEPIVCSPYDALKCFMNTGIDVLVLGNEILFKKEQEEILVDNLFKESFDLD